jgi:RNA polymerase sigma factor (sigma-70 family)
METQKMDEREYSRLLRLLKAFDPDYDLDSAHDAYVELRSSSDGRHTTTAALVARAKYRGSDERRRRCRSAAVAAQFESREFEQPADAPLLKAELCECVRCAVRRLPTKYATTIALRFFEDLSVHEIAAILGMPEKTVYTHLKRGCKCLSADPVLVTLIA